MVVLLAITGVLAIFAVIWVINSPYRQGRQASGELRCDSTSPDGNYQCLLGLAHDGWCGNGELEWRWDAWAIGADDHTRGRPPTKTQASEPPATRVRRIPRFAFWCGIGFVILIMSVNYDTHEPVAPTVPDYDCQWRFTKCEQWKPASIGP